MSANLAPEFSGISAWLNTSPLTMASLRGKVVGIAFWSQGCINCIHAVSRLQQLYDQYGSQGFVLIGVHSPESAAENDLNRLKTFLMQKHVTFPVAADADLATWKAFDNQYWPTLYLIDKQGFIREQHIGEGGYHRIAADMVHLLNE